MIRRPNNWNEVKEFSDRQKLPLGAYVCKVKRAAVQANEFGEQLCIVFDIVEGEFSGFFNEEFKNNTYDNKKWKGVLRLYIPKDDGSEKDEWTKRTFKGMVTAFEKSNHGFMWNWDENSLAGKMVGILFRNEEWENDEGKSGWTVRPFRAISVDSVRSEDFILPKDKPLKKKDSGYSAGGFGSVASAPNYNMSNYSNPASNFAVLEDDDAQLPF
jgi:hypothetical protein